MAQTVSLEQARDALRRHFGRDLRTTIEAGRAQLADALMQDFGLAEPEARRLVRELEDAHTIRWVQGGDTVSSDNSLAGTQFGAQGLPPAAISGLTHSEGYWEL